MADYNFNTNLGPAPQQGTSLGDLINTARGVQAYQQAEQLNPLAAEKAKLELEQARIGTEKAKFGFAGDKYDKAAKIAGASATDKVLAERIAKGDANGIVDYFHSKMSDLKKAGFTDAEALSSVAKFVDLAHTSPQHIIPALENLSTQAITPESQVGLQTGQIERNAAGNLVNVNRSRNTISPVGQNSQLDINPSSNDVSMGGEYQKGLSNRVQASNQYLQRSEELKSLAGAFKAGAGTQTMANVAGKLQAIGAPQELVDKVAGGDLSAIQSYNKFLAQSVIAGVRQAAGAGGEARVAEVENYLKNNPTVNTDPRALQRFIDFGDKLAQVDITENQAMAAAKKAGIYNPGTWQADWQNMAQKQGLLPKTPVGSGPVSENKSRKVVKEGTYKGRPVVQYEDGTVEYK